MSKLSGVEITRLLNAWSEGDQSALERLMPVVYKELRRLAHRYMNRERADHILQTTALVNEAYVRLVDMPIVRWQNRTHFFAISARLMRRILVDFARSRQYLKRGGKTVHVQLDEAMLLATDKPPDLISLDDALTALAAVDERKSKVVEMRFFGGMTVEETAEALGISPETVMRDWKTAKVWLLRQLSKQT